MSGAQTARRASAGLWNYLDEYLPTFLAEFVVMASQVAVYKMAARYLGKQGFSEYAMARRTVSLIFPLPALGLSVGLPRYIGFSNGRKDWTSSSRYYAATMWCVMGAAGICVLVLNRFSDLFGFLFFGDRRYGYLAFPLSMMILGLCLHTVVCGYFRGHLQLNRANLLQVLNLGIAPVAALFVFRRSLGATLTGLGTVWMGIAGSAFLLTPFQVMAQNTWKEMNVLLRYGIQRVPGDFVLMSLFTLPAVMAAHFQSVQEAGTIAFGTTVLSMIGAVFAPAGLVLLPKATFMFAQGSAAELREHLRFLVGCTVMSSFIIMLITWICIPRLMLLYLGPGYEQVTSTVRLLVWGAVPYSLYILLRIVVDAYHEYGVTGLILLAGLGIFLAGAFVGRHFGFAIQASLLALLAALFSVATLSILECRRILHA